MKENRVYFISFVGVLLLGALIYAMTRNTSVYYYELAEAAQDKPMQEVRVGAQVVPGSISYHPEKFLLTFEIYDPKAPEKMLKVVSREPRPDNLMDDVMVLVRGKVDWEQGVLNAREVLVKCPSRYEPPK